MCVCVCVCVMEQLMMFCVQVIVSENISAAATSAGSILLH